MAANPIDLTDVSTVKSYMDVVTHDDDDLIQFLITAFSQNVHTRVGATIQYDSENNPSSPLNSVLSFVEVYNGGGNIRLFLRNRPIQTLTLVQEGNRTLPVSPGFAQPGIFIEPGGKSIAWRTGNLQGTTWGSWPWLYGYFPHGIGNIQVTYTAGYTSTPYDLQEAISRVVAQNYLRTEWLDLKQKNITQGGGTTYRDWQMPPECEHVIQNYSRQSVWS